ncbi:HAD family hydrolase [Streptomyces sp. BE147]|uniref:HAD family hydrolase n=1 Tax=Streptomyces sp. BE147 TaxID=3002524 RepID=UPI002E7620AE|nr:HAD family hydrolase [Streptomyces sp. BE147]
MGERPARRRTVPWRQDRGTPVPTMIALLNEVRRHVPTRVLSNCTDALATDLQHHGITFDHICSSAELGVDKPSPHAFRLAADRMGLPPTALAYFDDERTFVTAALTTGLHAHQYRTPERTAHTLRSMGLPCR